MKLVEKGNRHAFLFDSRVERDRWDCRGVSIAPRSAVSPRLIVDILFRKVMPFSRGVDSFVQLFPPNLKIDILY